MKRATLVGYEWASYYDDAQEKRVSDWEHAEHCDRCKAKIVHKYTIQQADGETELVGRECAHKALGWGKQNRKELDRRASAIEFMEENRQQTAKYSYANRKKHRSDAIRDCYRRNQRTNFTGVIVIEKDDEFYAFPIDCHATADMLTNRFGWTIVT